MPVFAAVATIRSKPGLESLLRDALIAVVEPTREEAGCFRFDLFESDTAPGTFIVVEAFADQSAVDEHLKTDYMARLLSSAGHAIDGEAHVQRITALG